MIALVQRVREASVSVDEKPHNAIGAGLLVLLGITHEDTEKDVAWLAQKVAKLRIFSDSEGKMNLSVQDVGGEVLVISQFTLHGDTRKGNRPSYVRAARPEQAEIAVRSLPQHTYPTAQQRRTRRKVWRKYASATTQ